MLVIGSLEWKVSLKAYPLIYEARGTDETQMLQSILEAMDQEQQRFHHIDRDTIGTLDRVSFSLKATKRHHERLRTRLLAEPAITQLKTYRDPEED